MPTLFQPLSFACGLTMRNRFMLAPLTNCQSHADGTLSDAEARWLTMRAEGGFGLTMTCASHVQKVGQGFPGQLGIFSDAHIPGLTGLAAAIRKAGSLSMVQLHHAGLRSDSKLTGTPVAPSDDAKTGARGLTGPEVEQLREDFIAAAVRAQKAGFDGVEVHGAHGYIITQFLAAASNRRTDRYGGSLENRARIMFEILDGIRAACGPAFLVGIRLSPERFGLKLAEVLEVYGEIIRRKAADFIDLSLWDVDKLPEEAEFNNRTLTEHFLVVPRGDVRIGVAGKVKQPEVAARMIGAGADFVMLGRAAIINHDFPAQMQRNPAWQPTPTPAPESHFAAECVSPVFIGYLRSMFKGMVAE
jgi:2,4-dienoyl-CoA reductase-like NADH-dependent reductase (Old Yellow Enzyme family)